MRYLAASAAYEVRLYAGLVAVTNSISEELHSHALQGRKRGLNTVMAGLHDMARMSVTGTPGTGTITLGSAATGYQTFTAAGVQDGEIVTYGISDTASGGWEVGRGIYTASGTTLTRGPIYSSNSNTAVSFASTAIIFITFLAEDFMATITIPHAFLGGI